MLKSNNNTIDINEEEILEQIQIIKEKINEVNIIKNLNKFNL